MAFPDCQRYLQGRGYRKRARDHRSGPESQEEIKISGDQHAEEWPISSGEGNDVLVASTSRVGGRLTSLFVDQKEEKSLGEGKDGKILKVAAPLYVEMSLIDRSGNETVRIVNGAVAGKNQLETWRPLATRLTSPRITFQKPSDSARVKVYVSHVTGWYVTKQEFEKGKRYSGCRSFRHPDLSTRVGYRASWC